MGTTSDKLQHLSTTKSLIRQAIIDKAVPVPSETTFRLYADKVSSIPTGGGHISNICDMAPHTGYYTDGTKWSTSTSSVSNFVVQVVPETPYIIYVASTSNRFRLTSWASDPTLGGTANSAILETSTPSNGLNKCIITGVTDKFLNIYYTANGGEATIYVYPLVGIQTGEITNTIDGGDENDRGTDSMST